MTLLHHIGLALRQGLQTIPLEAARALFLLALGALLVWVLLLPRRHTCPTPDEPCRPMENLKWWAALALALQCLIYALW
jgi:hypothetical protein